MRCKQGDLAYIIKSLRPANLGKFVTCKHLIGNFKQGEQFMHSGEVFTAYDTDAYWVVECKSGLETLYGSSIEAIIIDSWLKPLKADPTELLDEIKELDLVE